MQNKRTLIYILFIMGMYSANSQNWSRGITGNVGVGKVNSSFPTSSDEKFALSGNLGAFFEKKITPKSSLGFEILWVQMEGNEETKNKILTVSNGQSLEIVGVISDKTRLHSSYLGIPAYLRVKFRKIGFKAGPQPMIFLFASSNYQAKGTLYNAPYEAESSTSGIKLSQLELGTKFGVDYGWNHKFIFRADYYHGFTSITTTGSPLKKMNRQLTLGIQYVFSKQTSKR